MVLYIRQGNFRDLREGVVTSSTLLWR